MSQKVVLPVASARLASILHVERQSSRQTLSDETDLPPFLGHYDGFVSVETLRDRLLELAKRESVKLSADHSLLDLVLAALSRCNIVANGIDISDTGLLSTNDAHDSRLEEIHDLREYNFDTALTRYVTKTVAANGASAIHGMDLQARFCPDGKIPLLISTKQEDRSKLGFVGNVGDNFGYWVTKALSHREVVPYGTWVDRDLPIMLTIGSFMQHARNRGLVWGTGCVTDMPWGSAAIPTSSIFLGVRGPRTREQLLRRFEINPPVIGDPGILISEIIPPADAEPDQEIGFILHGVDRPFFMERWPGMFIVNNTSSFETSASDIRRCKRVISSSLHGLIFAHALGVPVEIVSFGDRLAGGEFKFIDYMQSIGNYSFTGRLDCSSSTLGIDDWCDIADKAYRPSLGDLSSKLHSTFPFRNF